MHKAMALTRIRHWWRTNTNERFDLVGLTPEPSGLVIMVVIRGWVRDAVEKAVQCKGLLQYPKQPGANSRNFLVIGDTIVPQCPAVSRTERYRNRRETWVKLDVIVYPSKCHTLACGSDLAPANRFPHSVWILLFCAIPSYLLMQSSYKVVLGSHFCYWLSQQALSLDSWVEVATESNSERCMDQKLRLCSME